MKNQIEKQICSIGQMKHLEKLGINTSCASMYWALPVFPRFRPKLGVVDKNRNLDLSKNNRLFIGAFTLWDILNILPIRIQNKYTFRLYKIEDGWIAKYSNEYTGDLFAVTSCTIIEAAYCMLEWLADQKLLIQDHYVPK